MDLRFMFQIQISASRPNENQSYDPLMCKTCQKLASYSPKPARIPYSDCEEHFHERVMHLLLTGGLRII